jgi:hypothetical protein
MIALLVLTADSCAVFLLPSLGDCMIAGHWFLPFARVFCMPAGVMV